MQTVVQSAPWLLGSVYERSRVSIRFKRVLGLGLGLELAEVRSYAPVAGAREPVALVGVQIIFHI